MKYFFILCFGFLLLTSQALAVITLNPSDKSSSITLSNGNMTASGTISDFYAARVTESKSSGKWYFEVYIDVQGTYAPVSGVMQSGATLADLVGYDTSGWGWGSNFLSNASKYYNNAATTLGSGLVATDIAMYAVDIGAGKIWFGANDAWNGDPAAGTGEAFTGITGPLFAAVSLTGGTSSVTIRLTDTDCTYTAPSGFTYYDPPTFAISGTFEINECDGTTEELDYLIIDASSTPHANYAYGTTDSDGTWSEDVADTDDEYCGAIITDSNMVYSGDWATAIADGSGEFTLENASWADGDDIWVLGIDPTKTKKSISQKYTADASHQVSDTYEHDGVAESGGLIIGYGFGTTGDEGILKPVFDFATGN